MTSFQEPLQVQLWFQYCWLDATCFNSEQLFRIVDRVLHDLLIDKYNSKLNNYFEAIILIFSSVFFCAFLFT